MLQAVTAFCFANLPAGLFTSRDEPRRPTRQDGYPGCALEPGPWFKSVSLE